MMIAMRSSKRESESPKLDADNDAQKNVRSDGEHRAMKWISKNVTLSVKTTEL